MNPYKEALDLLERMKASGEYFHLSFIDGVIEGLLEAQGHDFVPDSLCDWSNNMWSR